MHPAQLLDALVDIVTSWPPLPRKIAAVILRPFIYLRFAGIARTLRKQYRWLPATSWEAISKHGENVVFAKCKKIDIYTKEEKVVGMWVVDYKNRTVRVVTDIPDEYCQSGKTF